MIAERNTEEAKAEIVHITKALRTLTLLVHRTLQYVIISIFISLEMPCYDCRTEADCNEDYSILNHTNYSRKSSKSHKKLNSSQKLRNYHCIEDYDYL